MSGEPEQHLPDGLAISVWPHNLKYHRFLGSSEVPICLPEMHAYYFDDDYSIEYSFRVVTNPKKPGRHVSDRLSLPTTHTGLQPVLGVRAEV